MIEFDYIKDEPVIPVTLENGDNIVKIRFFVDSGADITMITLGVAKKLGFNAWNDDEIVNALGVGGSDVPYFVRQIDITIGNEKWKIRVACSLRDDVPFLLGRRDIFDKFQVCFNDKEKRIRFTEL